LRLGRFASPRNRILEASKANVCSLLNTFAIRFTVGGFILWLRKISNMFKREQQMRSSEFKL
jgi:hypothetical protein